MGKIGVLLAEDLTLVREGIRSVLGNAPDIEIVAEAETGEDAIRIAGQTRPDVVLMDQDMPQLDGLEATRRIKQAMPDIEIIVMTDRLDDGKALEAIEAGATGYILKDIPSANLAAAIRAFCQGRAFFHPEVARKLMERLSYFAREQRAHQRDADGLTAREVEMLSEIAKGHTDRQIAKTFTLSERTVKTHIHHILGKLKCSNRTQAVAHVMRRGLIK